MPNILTGPKQICRLWRRGLPVITNGNPERFQKGHVEYLFYLSCYRNFRTKVPCCQEELGAIFDISGKLPSRGHSQGIAGVQCWLFHAQATPAQQLRQRIAPASFTMHQEGCGWRSAAAMPIQQ